jgi:hypothetical protein
MYNQLEKMMYCMRALLDTPSKLDLLKDVRHFISSSQLMQYDNLVPYHKMAHPWKLSGVATMPRSRSKPHHVHVLTTPQRTPKMKPRVVNGNYCFGVVYYRSTNVVDSGKKSPN